ncbi:cation-transporting P-type ATPase, partial [Streptococcus anginosus]
MDVPAVENEFQTSTTGLTDAQAKERLDQYGPNEIQEGESKSTFQKFIDQFKDLMIIILLIAAVLSVVLEGYEGMVD